MHRTVAAALVAALALGVASCGGSEETLTRAQLVRQTELACAQAREMRANESGLGGSQADQREHFVVGIIKEERSILARLDELHPPDAAKDDFEALKHGIQQRAVLIGRLRGLTADDFKRGVAGLKEQGDAITTRLEAASERLGVKGCV